MCSLTKRARIPVYCALAISLLALYSVNNLLEPWAGLGGHELATVSVKAPLIGKRPLIVKPPLILRRASHDYVVGIACGIRIDLDVSLEQQPLLETLLPSVGPSLDSSIEYRLVFVYDANDPLWTNETNRQLANTTLKRGVADDVKVSMQFIRCMDCSGAPSKAHSKAVLEAYAQGCDYVFRVNDDTVVPANKTWTRVFIDDLLNRDMPNLGVVGPDFAFNVYTPILSHDFTHRTHVEIHGFHYPPTLPNWSADDWITYVYDQFNLTHKLPHVMVKHKTRRIRYGPSGTETRQKAMTEAIAVGAAKIQEYAQAHFSRGLVPNGKVYTTP